LNVQDQIVRAEQLSVSLEHLLVEKSYTIRNNRDGVRLLYWSLIFEHHQGILLLLRTKHYAPAFALMRPIAEAFLRLHLVMHGTEAQLAAIKDGAYNTDFAGIGEQIDQMAGLEEPLLGAFFKKHTKILHGFTHGGLEQLMRRSDGPDIIANYPDDEVRDVVNFTTMFAFLTAVHVADYLNLGAEFERANKIHDEYRQAISQVT
jgi:hypothetical protein